MEPDPADEVEAGQEAVLGNLALDLAAVDVEARRHKLGTLLVADLQTPIEVELDWGDGRFVARFDHQQGVLAPRVRVDEGAQVVARDALQRARADEASLAARHFGFGLEHGGVTRGGPLEADPDL